MKDKNEKRDILLACAKTEFLKKGYEQASLRVICTQADVTTGALYFYFKNKADLFDALVRDVAINLQKAIEHQLEEFYEKHSELIDEELVSYLIENKEAVVLLCNKSRGTKYEGFKRMVEDRVADYINAVLEERTGKTIDKEIGRIIAEMKVNCYYTIINKAYTTDQAMLFIKNLIMFSESGFKRMLDSLKCL